MKENVKLKPFNIEIYQNFVQTGMEKRRSRPLGVAIISILAGINGILLVTGGIFAVFVLPTIVGPQLNSNLSNLPNASQLNSQMTLIITRTALTGIIVVGSVGIALGLGWFVLARGIWTAKGWVLDSYSDTRYNITNTQYHWSCNWKSSKYHVNNY